ncbi:MAG: hypothetical protein FE044_01135 [Thermoplasmata archaeon]|nr:MAG: hypothetical protein FE044_01135 [Thermoplasmata archaeon]MCD6573415.1 hypothetical protein [Thermoplasmata archaeon]
MAIEDLIQEIKSNAKAEVESIIKKANEEAEEIIKKAEKEANEEAEEIIKKAEKEAKTTKGRILAMARRNANKYIIEAKEKLINECIEEIKKELKKLPSRQYKKFIEKILKEAIKEMKDGYILASRKEDEEIAKKMGIEVKGKIDAIGGVIIKSKDGSKEINSTFDALLERRRDEIRIKIAEKLWKQ